MKILTLCMCFFLSVGSLGVAKSEDRVEQVHAQHCTFTNTQNGARIKTRQVR